MPGRGHPADPGPALVLVPSVAFGFEAGNDGRIVESGPPQTFGNADRLGCPINVIWNACGAGVLSGMPGSGDGASLTNVIACS